MSGSFEAVPDHDRDRGILTTADREYLCGEREYSSEQSERDARYRIRKRVKNSILDFSILLNHLQDPDRKQIFQSNFPQKPDSGGDPDISLDDFEEIVEKHRFQDSMSNAIGFLYLATMDVNWRVESAFSDGIKQAEEKRGFVVDDVSVDISVSRKEAGIDELIKRFEEGDSLTPEELRTVLRSDSVDVDAEMLDRVFEEFVDDLSEEIEDGDLELSGEE